MTYKVGDEVWIKGRVIRVAQNGNFRVEFPKHSVVLDFQESQLRPATPEPETCKWRKLTKNIVFTSCCISPFQNAVEFTGDIEDTGFVYCPHCGRKIEVVE